MNIEFNPNRGTYNRASQPVSRRDAVTPAPESHPFEKAAALEQYPKGLPLVRPEKVEKARALIADVQFPPNEMLDRIANLLALHIKPI